jgi:3-hydroxymyristoyl/3-hydroxydecanoyl-(acyl carrier protein) dehydratase
MIRKEVEQCMTVLAATGSALTASFIFAEEFVGFQGHFPTKKVLPGACQVQCALLTIEKESGRRITLKEIALAKFTAPIFPGDAVYCAVTRVSDTEDLIVYKVKISKGEDKVSELKLCIAAGDSL